MFFIIDRYIAKLFLGFFLAGLIVFITLFVAIDLMSNMVRYDTTTTVLIQYYSAYIFEVLYQMLPVGCLVGTVFTLSSMNRSQELVALFSSGMSLIRISMPILVLVGLLSGLSFWFGDQILPKVILKKNAIYYTEIKKNPSLISTVKLDKIWYRSHNMIFNIKNLQPESKSAQGLTFYFFDSSWKLVEMMTAASVQMNGREWVLGPGTVTLFATPTQAPATQNFPTKKMLMTPDLEDIQAASPTAATLSLKQLHRFIERNKAAGLQTATYEVDMYGKYSFAFAAFVMSFLGIPFTVAKARSGGMSINIGFCVLLAFSYWAMFSSGLTLGKHGSLPPMLAAWGPNIVALAFSGVLLRRLKR